MAASRRDLATTDEPDLTFTVKPRPPVWDARVAAGTMIKARRQGDPGSHEQ